MNTQFFIVDDDINIVRMLSNIIENNDLGIILGHSSCGKDALDKISILNPDIVLIDLLLPELDGLEIVSKIKVLNPKISFIMISDVTSTDMISRGYNNGIEFFINKPINVIEVVSIIKKSIEKIELLNALNSMKKVLSSIDLISSNTSKLRKEDFKGDITKVFSEIGIIGENGSEDLIMIINELAIERITKDNYDYNYNVSDLYTKIYKKYEVSNSSVSIKAIEQRIRRIIQSALENIAFLGIEDFSHFKFEKYSSTLFDFKEVKAEMDYLRNKSKYKGKINMGSTTSTYCSITFIKWWTTSTSNNVYCNSAAI